MNNPSKFILGLLFGACTMWAVTALRIDALEKQNNELRAGEAFCHNQVLEEMRK